ncbi:MAG: fused MFS/spermidine synthase, partial [Gemmatimonadota bacterium]
HGAGSVGSMERALILARSLQYPDLLAGRGSLLPAQKRSPEAIIDPGERDVGLTIDRGIRRIILALFFLSGACGLVYEVVWMRMLTLVFGATAFATAAVLASFFAGLALGSLSFGRAADRSRNPLALYALLEAVVAVFAFLMPALLAGVTAIYVALARHVELGFYALSLVRLGLSFVVLLLPTTLMGGTLPVVVKFLVQRRDRLGMDVGRLYAVNTFGAVLGAFAAGFVLILAIGVRETAYLAGAVNLVIAGVAFHLSRGVEQAGAGARADAGEKEATQTGRGRKTAGRTSSNRGWPDSHSGQWACRVCARWRWKCSGRGRWSTTWTTRPTRSPRC